jgi:hypothetical protein
MGCRRPVPPALDLFPGGSLCGRGEEESTPGRGRVALGRGEESAQGRGRVGVEERESRVAGLGAWGMTRFFFLNRFSLGSDEDEYHRPLSPPSSTELAVMELYRLVAMLFAQ